MSAKPGWVRRVFRKVRGRCPWCARKMEEVGVPGFGWLNWGSGCPDGHYLAYTDIGAHGATVVVEDGGRVISSLRKRSAP